MTVTKIAAVAGAALLLPVLLIAAAAGTILGSTTRSASPSPTALADIPADYLPLYLEAAGVCAGLDWNVLAAVGKVETDHGRSSLPGVHNGQNQAGAGGVMQILTPTWNDILAHHHIPPGGTRPPSRYNPHDAIHAAAYYLCDNGAGRGDIEAALYAYNHSSAYVEHVLAVARSYSQTNPSMPVTCGPPRPGVPPGAQDTSTRGTADTSTRGTTGTGTRGGRALTAVRFACAQLGKPYVWGGNGEIGFDCSGLTHAAYAAAGVEIPRTAQTQYNSVPLLPTGTPLQPGDLVFFGTPQRIHHVGISLGGTLIVNAPDFGQTVKTQDLRDYGDYAGASRPAPDAWPRADRGQSSTLDRGGTVVWRRSRRASSHQSAHGQREHNDP